MSTKIKLYDCGDCVSVNTWESCDEDGFFVPGRAIGLVLEAQLVEMGDNEDMNMHDEKEWMYRVILPSGRVTEVWDYEIRPVNIIGKEYNNSSQQAK